MFSTVGTSQSVNRNYQRDNYFSYQREHTKRIQHPGIICSGVFLRSNKEQMFLKVLAIIQINEYNGK